MKHLILKDFLLLKGNTRLLPVFLMCFLVMMINNIEAASFIIPFLCTTMCISTFSYDDYNKWDAYAITLPKGRTKVVQGKYAFSILFILFGTLVAFLITSSILLIQNKFVLEQLLGTIIGGFAGTIVVISVMYPILYKYGTEKGRLVTFLFIFIGSLVVGLGFEKLSFLQENIPSIINLFENFWYIIIPLLLIMIVSISYQVSKNIYLKKEF